MTNSNGFTASTAGAVYNGLNVNGGDHHHRQQRHHREQQHHRRQHRQCRDPDRARRDRRRQIDNDSIHGTNAVQSGSLAFAVSNFGSTLNWVTIDHTNFYNGDRILAGYGTVTNSYCLGGANFSNSGGLEHDECIYTDGTAPGIRAIHDTLLIPNCQTAAVFVDNPEFGGGSVNGTVDIENSILAGGDYCLYGGDGTLHRPHRSGNDYWEPVRDPFFPTCGQFGPDGYLSDNATWSDNVWDNTNAVINP